MVRIVRHFCILWNVIKQLKQRDFLKRCHAENLQHRMQRQIQLQPLASDRHQDVGGDGDPDLALDRVFRGAEKSLDPQMLLYPLEGQLSGKGLARCLGRCLVRFQPLPIGTAREVFPQAARPVRFIERVMGRLDQEVILMVIQ